jgi:3'-phosphoadenosine 5'-phosphosulfate sulfotransferase (PAPS reductase)/FAD synthetase
MASHEPSIADGALERLRAAQADIRDEYLAANQDPWIIGYSGGKDSTLAVTMNRHRNIAGSWLNPHDWVCMVVNQNAAGIRRAH